VVLAAPSGAGKTTIAQALVARRPDVGFSISATTRPPRASERDGTDYLFLAAAEFDRRVQAGDFLEWAEYAGHRYGTLRSEVDRIRRAGRNVLLDIEVQGAAQVRRAYPWPHSVAIFLLPPSGAELARRLRARGTETPAALVRRLAWAADEIAQAPAFDWVVINDALDDAVGRVSQAIDAEQRDSRPADLQQRVDGLRRELQREIDGELQRGRA
jgi:guanylate kinase